jgi:hypothetical protein
VLTLLTIVYQERKPSIICIEDIDRGIHPALFGKIVDVCRALVRVEGAPQIIATTHNPYVVDQFIDDEDSVVIVEKVDADTTFTTLRERLKNLDGSSDTLGGIWYSGLVGGARGPREAPPPVAHSQGRLTRMAQVYILSEDDFDDQVYVSSGQPEGVFHRDAKEGEKMLNRRKTPPFSMVVTAIEVAVTATEVAVTAIEVAVDRHRGGSDRPSRWR